MISSALTKKDRIIVSALKLFSEHGYQDTKIINIAKDAKVGKDVYKRQVVTMTKAHKIF